MSYALYAFHYIALYTLTLPPWPCDGTTGNPSLDDLKLGSEFHLLTTSTTKDDTNTNVLILNKVCHPIPSPPTGIGAICNPAIHIHPCYSTATNQNLESVR